MKVEIPEFLSHLPTFNGMPVPWVILKDNAGNYNFKVNDTGKVLKAIKLNLCAICGKMMGFDRWLTGGVISAFDHRGAYKDTPMHHACSHFALKTCPYLAFRSYNISDPMKDKRLKNIKGHVLVDPTIIMDRPTIFVNVKIRGFNMTQEGYLHPIKPYLEIEYWKHGEQITDEEAIELYKETGPYESGQIKTAYTR